MVTARKPIHVTEETELVRLLDQATSEPVLLEKDGVVYQINRVDENEAIWAGYDPERVRAGVEAMAGIITPEQGARLKELIYRAREEGTRPPGRP